MKISERTIQLLKNYVRINNSIFFDEPGIIKTMSLAGNIISVADIEEQEIPKFGLYNLSEFLGMITLFDLEKTDFDFQERFVVIKCGRRRFRYIYTDMDLLPSYGRLKPAEKYKAFDKFDCKFVLSENDISSLKKASSIMKLTHIDIKAKEGKGIFTIFDDEATASNTFKVLVKADGECNTSFDIGNMLLLPGNYTIEICGKKLIKFTRDSNDIFYFVSQKP